MHGRDPKSHCQSHRRQDASCKSCPAQSDTDCHMPPSQYSKNYLINVKPIVLHVILARVCAQWMRENCFVATTSNAIPMTFVESLRKANMPKHGLKRKWINEWLDEISEVSHLLLKQWWTQYRPENFGWFLSALHQNLSSLAVGEENLALFRPTSQSSTWSNLVSSFAVDGDDISDLSSSATNDGDYHPWWKVELAYTAWVTHVEITNRVSAGWYEHA